MSAKTDPNSKTDNLANEDCRPVPCSPFECEAIGAQFECTHAIYPTGGQASICYVTSEQRGRLIVAALNHFEESGKLDEWMSAENTSTMASEGLPSVQGSLPYRSLNP
jgi:hypothetical protein